MSNIQELVAVVLMTRVPLPNKTKTRLIGTYTPEEVAALHSSFIKDISETLDMLPDDIALFVSYCDSTEEKESVLHGIIDNSRFNYFPQEGSTLWERQYNIFSKLLHDGYSKVIIIGSDIPQLSLETIQYSISQLNLPNQVVFGPSEDGGFYLFGVNILNRALNPIRNNFREGRVLDDFISHISRISLMIMMSVLRTAYRDIDTLEDLQYVASQIEAKNVCLHTRTCIANLNKEIPV